MARSKTAPQIDDTSIPYRVVIDFLEGTLRKQDAIAFARGFIENHFDSANDSGYYVQPYEGGYIFEAHEGGAQRAYLPGVMNTLQRTPTASACIQAARRVIEVKKSVTGVYTAILLPEGAEPQNLDKVFPEAGPKLIPYQRSGVVTLMAGLTIFGAGFAALLLSSVVYLFMVSGLISPPLAVVDYKSLPLTQWPQLQSITAGRESDKYVKAMHFQDGKWQWETGERQNAVSAVDLPPLPGMPGGDTTGANPLTLPMAPASTTATPPVATQPQATAPRTVSGRK